MSLNRQAAFDTAYLGLREQGFAPSVLTDDLCAYRGQAGMKCALGFLIPDEKYEAYVEDFGPGALSDRGFLGEEYGSIRELTFQEELQGVFPEERNQDIEFLNALQNAHDTSTSESMGAKLRQVAEEWSLTVPE